MRSSGLVAFGSYSTVAFSVAKFTLAEATPSFLESARSTRRTQEAQVIPVTGMVSIFSSRLLTGTTPLYILCLLIPP
jgi:hypothetical protein